MGITSGDIEPVPTDVARLCDEVKGWVVGLTLVEDVGELVVHRVEVILRHRTIVMQELIGEGIDLVECDLVAPLCTPDDLGALAGIGG